MVQTVCQYPHLNAIGKVRQDWLNTTKNSLKENLWPDLGAKPSICDLQTNTFTSSTRRSLRQLPRVQAVQRRVLLVRGLAGHVDVGGRALVQRVPLRDRLPGVVQHLQPVVAADADQRGPDGRAADELVGANPGRDSTNCSNSQNLRVSICIQHYPFHNDTFGKGQHYFQTLRHSRHLAALLETLEQNHHHCTECNRLRKQRKATLLMITNKTIHTNGKYVFWQYFMRVPPQSAELHYVRGRPTLTLISCFMQ